MALSACPISAWRTDRIVVNRAASRDPAGIGGWMRSSRSRHWLPWAGIAPGEQVGRERQQLVRGVRE